GMPVPGDEIVGFVSRGQGVSVHRADCPNAKALAREPERILEVSWREGKATSFVVAIQVEALDRQKLLRDVATVFSDNHVNIVSAASGWGRTASPPCGSSWSSPTSRICRGCWPRSRAWTPCSTRTAWSPGNSLLAHRSPTGVPRVRSRGGRADRGDRPWFPAPGRCGPERARRRARPPGREGFPPARVRGSGRQDEPGPYRGRRIRHGGPAVHPVRRLAQGQAAVVGRSRPSRAGRGTGRGTGRGPG